MPERKLTGLFITHDASNYGASRSLQLLLRNYHDVSVDMIVKKGLRTADASISDVSEKFGPQVGRVWNMYLPLDFCYTYRPEPSFKWSLMTTVNRLTALLDQGRLRRIMKEGNYDFIHLNSLVLHSLIRPELPCIIHIRDIYDGSNPMAVQSLRNAAGVIFIDEATRAPFRSAGLERSIVLNNPFDMTALKDYRASDTAWPEKGFPERVIFSIIGLVSEKKGIDFIIKCFLKVPNRNARLLIVGRGEEDYVSFCRKLAAHDPRVVFWGEEKDILNIYAVSDYILRGEAYQCIGRTIYEGLYAGCEVIVPVERQAEQQMFEYETFRDSIHPYRPRSEEELSAAIERLSGRKVTSRTYRSNVAEYVRRFDTFIREAAEAARAKGIPAT